MFISRWKSGGISDVPRGLLYSLRKAGESESGILSESAQIVQLSLGFIYILNSLYFSNCGHSATTSITSETAESLIAIPQMANLKQLRLDGIPEVFEFEKFFNFWKQHAKFPESENYVKSGGIFYFREPLSDRYKVRLQTYIDGILAEGVTGNPPPIIQFPGQQEKSREDLHKLLEAFYASVKAEVPPKKSFYNFGNGSFLRRIL